MLSMSSVSSTASVCVTRGNATWHMLSALCKMIHKNLNQKRPIRSFSLSPLANSGWFPKAYFLVLHPI